MGMPPEYAAKLGDPGKAAYRAIETIVGHYYAYPDRGTQKQLKEDMAEQCALGNPAACN